MNRAYFSLLIASHAIADPAEGWHLLLPVGETTCRDGRGPYQNDDPQRILDAFSAWGMPLDVDYHHQSLNAENQVGLVPSAGSVVELENRGGEVWGRFEWTEAASAAIQAKEVKYISPVFDYDKSWRILNLVSVGLTNLPNLYLNPLSANSLGGAMDEFLERFCYWFNLPLPPLTTPEQLKGYLQTLIDSLGNDPAAAVEAMSQLKVELRLDDKAKWPDVARAAHALAKPGQMVPRAEYDRVSHELAVLQKTGRDAQVAHEIEQAQKAGLLAPSMKDWARKYAEQDLEGFQSWAANAIPVVAAGQIIPAQPGHAADVKIPSGVSNPERWELLGKAKAHQAAHGCSFVEAVKAVQQPIQ